MYRAYVDRIPGGRADRHHPSEFDPRQLRAGILVEMEHTNDPRLALEIAMDHLVEMPDYYTRLATIEPHHGIGKVYTIGTNIPLVGSVQADIPIEEMAQDAMGVTKSELKSWFLLGLATIVSVGVAVIVSR